MKKTFEGASLQHSDTSSEDTYDGPELTFTLEQDKSRSNQLSLFGPKPPHDPINHRPGEEHLLAEGKLARSEFSARLQRVTFGTFKDKDNKRDRELACLILFHVDFCPRDRSWFRFRSASVEVEFKQCKRSAVESDVDEDPYDVPIIRDFFPRLIRGPTRTLTKDSSFTFEAGLPAAAPVNLNTNCTSSISRQKESVSLIHGRLMGDPANRVRWVIGENEVNRSGIYEAPNFAVIVKHRPQTKFSIALKLKATTLGGFDINAKNKPQIVLTPTTTPRQDGDMSTSSDGNATAPSPGLPGDSTVNAGDTGTAASSNTRHLENLENVDLAKLTRMEDILLGPQAPGAY